MPEGGSCRSIHFAFEGSGQKLEILLNGKAHGYTCHLIIPAARRLHHGLPDVLLGVQDDDVELRREHARYRHRGR